MSPPVPQSFPFLSNPPSSSTFSSWSICNNWVSVKEYKWLQAKYCTGTLGMPTLWLHQWKTRRTSKVCIKNRHAPLSNPDNHTPKIKKGSFERLEGRFYTQRETTTYKKHPSGLSPNTSRAAAIFDIRHFNGTLIKDNSRLGLWSGRDSDLNRGKTSQGGRDLLEQGRENCGRSQGRTERQSKHIASLWTVDNQREYAHIIRPPTLFICSVLLIFINPRH